MLITTFLVTASLAQTTRPAKPDGKKYTFKPLYRASEKLLLIYRMNAKMPMLDPVGRTPKMRGAITVTSPLSIAKGGAPGEKQITMRVRRIQMKYSIPNYSESIDTDKPKTLKSSIAAPWLKEPKKLLFMAKVDATGKIADFAREEKADDSKGSPFARAIKAIMINAPFRQVLAEPIVYLPPKPVKVGDTWNFARKVHNFHQVSGYAAMPLDEKTECKLIKVKKVAAGRIATIAISGTLKLQSDKTGAWIEIEMKKTGQVCYNIDKGTLDAHKVEMAGSCNQGSGKQSLTTKMKLTLRAELRKDTSPATTKPASAATTRPNNNDTK